LNVTKSATSLLIISAKILVAVLICASPPLSAINPARIWRRYFSMNCDHAGMGHAQAPPIPCLQLITGVTPRRFHIARSGHSGN